MKEIVQAYFACTDMLNEFYDSITRKMVWYAETYGVIYGTAFSFSDSVSSCDFDRLNVMAEVSLARMGR